MPSLSVFGMKTSTIQVPINNGIMTSTIQVPINNGLMGWQQLPNARRMLTDVPWTSWNDICTPRLHITLGTWSPVTVAWRIVTAVLPLSIA